MLLCPSGLRILILFTVGYGCDTLSRSPLEQRVVIGKLVPGEILAPRVK